MTPLRSLIVGYDARGEQLGVAVRAAAEVLDVRTELAAGSSESEYPEIAFAAAELVGRGDVDSAVLVCRSGLGMSIAANKVSGVRAARCTDLYSVHRARANCDANVLALPADLVSLSLGSALIREWLSVPFASPESLLKIKRVAAYEQLRRG